MGVPFVDSLIPSVVRAFQTTQRTKIRLGFLVSTETENFWLNCGSWPLSNLTLVRKRSGEQRPVKPFGCDLSCPPVPEMTPRALSSAQYTSRSMNGLVGISRSSELWRG